MEFGITHTEIHQQQITPTDETTIQDLLGSITNKVMTQARLSNVFADLYPLVRDYVTNRCFGSVVNPEIKKIRTHLDRLEVREAISKYLAKKLGELTVEKKTIEFEKANFKLSQTKPFCWRRNLPPLEIKNTIFNYVATYNDFERSFAEFLGKAKDVTRFASLGTTEQGDSGTQFRIDYLKPSGAIGFYHPDWVVVQKTDSGEVNWIIETKGRVWEDTTAKDSAMDEWCKRISKEVKKDWRFFRVNQCDFESKKFKTLEDVVTKEISKQMVL
jgi:type III restriction enzyme